MSARERLVAAVRAAYEPARVTDREKARCLDAIIVLMAREAGVQSAGALSNGRQDLAREVLTLAGRLLGG